MFKSSCSTPACRITVRPPYPPVPVNADTNWRFPGGGCKFGKPKWPRWLSEGKDAVGVLLHGKQPNFFGVMYVFDLWQGIREDTEMFTNQVRALEAIYVDSQSRRMQIW
jgi:hypothetical protein